MRNPVPFFVAMAVGAMVGIALAQQPPSSPTEQAISARLVQEINRSLACDAEIIRLREEIAELKKPKAPEKK